MSNILICGAGGFIGGHLTKHLLSKGHKLTCADVKPLDKWYQLFTENKNYSLDLRSISNTDKLTKDIDYVFNMACNMGGMGFIENNKAECMLSVLINSNLCWSSVKNKVQKYFFSSSACVYNASKQKETFIKGLREEDAYPADPEDGYGWEKLFSERMCRHFYEDFKLETRVVRYHNIYGPYGTYDGGREKAPAAICRKVIESIEKKSDAIDVWGDGEQTRSFLYIDDCIEGTMKVFDSDYQEVFNVGSEEQVSINQLINKVENISNYKVKKNYQLDKPKGVRGRNSDNTKILTKLKWEPKFSLEEGLKETYKWIIEDKNKNGSKSNFILF
jgi:nucleoside-diphosphate-sugar epimerase